MNVHSVLGGTGRRQYTLRHQIIMYSPYIAADLLQSKWSQAPCWVPELQTVAQKHILIPTVAEPVAIPRVPSAYFLSFCAQC
jgi:hypothetical protein